MTRDIVAMPALDAYLHVLMGPQYRTIALLYGTKALQALADDNDEALVTYARFAYSYILDAENWRGEYI